MQKIINKPENVVDDMLEGYVKAFPKLVAKTDNRRVLKYRNAPVKGKVGIVTGGGSGHKPAFIGYIGKNMVDAVAVGEIFSSPPAKMFFDAIKAADSGNGVACLYGNYAGDNMNMKMAIKMAEAAGIKVKTVVANDDVASAPSDQKNKRRGVAGEVFMWKVGGAKAAMGASLEEVTTTAQKAIDNTRSIGIGIKPCTIPEVGHPNFTIENGTMEVGIGHHGEPGILVSELEEAGSMAARMGELILNDMKITSGDEAAVLVSGLGATSHMELYIFYSHIFDMLVGQGIKIHKAYVGNYFTSLDMEGVTLTVMKLDEELKECMDLPADSMGLKEIGRCK